MLLGEYAVLHGKPALVCAVDKRIYVTLTPRDDTQIEIHSTLGEYTTTLGDIKIERPFHFILGVLQQYQSKMRRGCRLEIRSEFSEQIGFGSSAAVTVATLAALVTWLNIRVLPIDMIRQGRNIIRHIQGVGSGADIAASVYGGMVVYQAQLLAAERHAVQCPLTALYAGFKTPTVEAIKQVQSYFAAYPNLFRQLSQSIGQCVVDSVPHVRRADWTRVGEIMNVQQGLMESLGVSTPLLRAMLENLREQSPIFGAKISGSGLGDCVIGLGELQADYCPPATLAGVRRIPVAVTLQGVACEKS
jgi:mevalonate kinase